MTVLDSFYILFKSNADEAVAATKKVENATKAVEEATAELSKAQEDAGKKVGKNLTDQEKHLISLQQKKKAAMQEQRAAEKEQDKIDKERLNTGNEFVKVIEKTAAAAAAYFSISAIGGGIFNAAKNNSDLKVQGDLLGQNVERIKALDAAGRAAGGEKGGIFAQYAAVFHDLSSKGLQAPDIETLNRFYREQLKLPQFQGKGGADRFFQGLPQPITDAGQKSLLTLSNEDFEREISKQKELAKNSEISAEKAREFNKAISETGTLLDSIFTNLGYKVLPILTSLNKTLLTFDQIIAGNWEKLRIDSDKTWSQTHGGQAAPTLPPVPGEAKLASSSQSSKDSMEFWVSQGYPRDVAAGIAANEQRESNGNPNAIGDNGAARGLYQWHPDRVAKIKAGIGIDVTSASADDQRRAAAWEIEQMGLKDSLLNSGGAYNSASLFSKKFERPANGVFEAAIRGQSAINLANSSPFGMASNNTANSKNITVKIGDVNISNQGSSSDISRNVASELVQQIRDAIANTDDGVAM